MLNQQCSQIESKQIIQGIQNITIMNITMGAGVSIQPSVQVFIKSI